MQQMKMQELLDLWERTAHGALTPEEYQVRLPIEDAAKIQALAEMYPRRTVSEIITDLLSVALENLESALPYVRGDKVVAVDEEGDPLYEDIGPTPRYQSLLRKHLDRYQHASQDTH
jgi:hypothetical protein